MDRSLGDDRDQYGVSRQSVAAGSLDEVGEQGGRPCALVPVGYGREDVVG